MPIAPPPRSQDICQRLLRGYQFSSSDLQRPETAELYTVVNEQFAWFQSHLAAVGFTLQRDDGIILLQKDGKELSGEEQQTIVVLYLLADLWLEAGKSYRDLFQMPVAWTELDWFRDGYGKEYLAQVGIAAGDHDAIEEVLRKIARKGLVYYTVDTRMVMLRKPAERLYTLARAVHQHLHATEDNADA